MNCPVSKDQLKHELAMISAKAALDAYIKVELDPDIGVHFDGGVLAGEALIAYESAYSTLDTMIIED